MKVTFSVVGVVEVNPDPFVETSNSVVDGYGVVPVELGFEEEFVVAGTVVTSESPGKQSAKPFPILSAIALALKH